MSLPQTEINLVGTHILPVADLGLAETVTTTTSVSSVVFHTLYPATVVVISKLASGSGTIKIDRDADQDGVAFGSADVSLSVSGTSRQVAALDTTSSELWVGIQQSATGGNCVWSELAVFVLYELTAGEYWHDLRSAHNCVGADNGLSDGSGTVDLAIDA